MTKLISNSSSKTLYLDKSTGSTFRCDQLRWTLSQLSKASLDNHLTNSFEYIPNPRTYLPVVEDFCPIHPKTIWLLDGATLTQVQPSGASKPMQYEAFESKLGRYIDALDAQKAALEFSGGLDTALIYGFLKMKNKVPTLIGVVSDRYEFRTESYIQRKIMLNHPGSIMLTEDGTFPFADLENTPHHSIPDKTSLFYGFFRKTLEGLDSSVRILINGVAGDTLLAEKISSSSPKWLFNEWWAREHVYGPAGVDYRSAYSLDVVRAGLRAMRIASGEDSQKLWARERFAALLPVELANYSYKAAHDGVLYQGLEESVDTILHVAKSANAINKDPRIHPNAVYRLIKRWRDYEHRELVCLLAVISFAVWIFVNSEGRSRVRPY